MSLGKIKALLLLLMATGAVAYFGGGDGTVASFTAQVTNAGDGITSGTLLLSDSVAAGSNGATQSATTCLSQNASSNDNNYANCGAVITLPKVAPGVFGGVAQITVKNTGSLDARDLYLSAPSVNPTLSAALSNTQTSITVASLSGAVTKGQEIIVGPAPGGGNPTTTEIFYANANVSASTSPVSIALTAAATNSTAYPIGTPVDIKDCYDTVATGEGFNQSGTSPAGNNALCGSSVATLGGLVMYVQEVSQTIGATTTNYNYCWYGNSYGATGACAAPLSTTLSAVPTLNGSSQVIALPIASMDGNVYYNSTTPANSNQITVAQGTCTQTFTVNQSAYMNLAATSPTISVTPVAPTCTFTSGATVVSTTADTHGPISTLDSDTHTIFSFDASDEAPNGVSMPMLTANGTQESGTAFSEMPAGESRVFDVGIFLAEPTGTVQNTLQGLLSTFGLTWHIDE
jgi:hypothetical protein